MDDVGASAPGGGYRVELCHDAVQAHKALTFVGSATDPTGPATLDGKTFPRNHDGHPGDTIDDSSTTSGISPLVDQSIANGKRVTTVDMYAAMTAQANYRTALMSDFLHPNDAGYVVMGNVWYAAIQSYLPAAP